MDTLQETPSNVIDLRSRERIMPKKIRSLLMGQYVESKANDHTPEQFAEFLERRILGDVAIATAKYVKSTIEGITGRN